MFLPSRAPDCRRPAGPSGRRRLATRRAYLALFSALVAFVVLQFTVSASLNLWFPEAMDPTYGACLRRFRKAVAAAAAPPHTVVMLGTSRTNVGLDSVGMTVSLSQQLGRPVVAGNFGVKGAGPADELVTWRRLNRDGVHPDLLLVEVLPAYLGDDMPPLDAGQTPPGSLDWFDLPSLARYRNGSRRQMWAEAALAETDSLYNRRLAILNAAAPKLLPPAMAAIQPPGPNFLADDSPAEIRNGLLEASRQVLGGRLSHLRLGGVGGEALRDLLTSCRTAAVPAAVVVMPEGTEYRSWYLPGSWPAVRQWLEQVCLENEADFINASEWIDDDDFLDSHHLLARGAKKFTERLGRECVLLWLRRNAVEKRP